MASTKAGKTPAPPKKTAKPAAPVKVRAGSVASKRAKPAAKKPEAPKPPSIEQRMDAYGGIEAVECALIERKTLTEIAADVGVSFGSLWAWLDSVPERSARAREARAKTAAIWDHEATSVIERAGDQFELAKAKELAHHYRWRASKIAPREYGEKVQQEHTGANGGAIVVDSRITLVSAPSRPVDEDEA